MDDFFQAAFGGSFLNHQWLIAAATPTWPGAPVERLSVVDANGMPNNYALYHALGPVVDDRLTALCPAPLGLACGDYTINTIQPTYQPHGGRSFIKPIAPENEHPGYTSETRGSDHLVSLLRAIEGSECAKDTMVVVTYGEFGGQWDHVPPPGQGGAPGIHDQWGPGTRVPALVVSPLLRGNFVLDHTQYDTTSIERRFSLLPLSTRDAAVNDLSNVFDARQFGER